MKAAVHSAILIWAFALWARGDEITANQFPGVAARIDFFQPRVNSKNADVRRRALIEITYFHYHPSKEFVGFLRRMCNDEDPVIRGYAVRHLYQMFVNVDVKSLPQPIGWHATVGDDYSDANFQSELLNHFRNGGASGAIAEQLGYLRLPEAAPLLRVAAKQVNDPMTQTEIARALLECGDTESAVGLWREVIKRFAEHYASKSDENLSEYYYVQACWGLAHVERTRLEGLSALAKAMTDFEHAATPNSLNKLEYAQKLFASATGTWCSTGAEARQMLETHERSNMVKQDGADQPAAAPESKSEDKEEVRSK